MINNPVIQNNPVNEFNQWFIILLSIRDISWNVHQSGTSSFAGLLFLMTLSIRGFSWNYTNLRHSLSKSFFILLSIRGFSWKCTSISPSLFTGFSCCYQYGTFLEMCINLRLIIYGGFIFDDAINTGLFMKMPSNSHSLNAGLFIPSINSFQK